MKQLHGEIEFTITDVSPEHVLAEMPVRPGVLNPYGVVNAGAMLWFADVCASTLAYGKDNFAPGAPGFPLGVSLNAVFVGNQRDGVFKSTSSFVKRGRQLSVVRTVITGAEDRLIADITTSHIAAK